MHEKSCVFSQNILTADSHVKKGKFWSEHWLNSSGFVHVRGNFLVMGVWPGCYGTS